MNTETVIKAKYTTKRTALKHNLDLAEYEAFVAQMGDKLNISGDTVEIIGNDPTSDYYGQAIETAEFILVWDEKAQYWWGELLFGEMESTFTMGDDTMVSTDECELEISGKPSYRRNR